MPLQRTLSLKKLCVCTALGHFGKFLFNSSKRAGALSFGKLEHHSADLWPPSRVHAHALVTGRGDQDPRPQGSWWSSSPFWIYLEFQLGLFFFFYKTPWRDFTIEKCIAWTYFSKTDEAGKLHLTNSSIQKKKWGENMLVPQKWPTHSGFIGCLVFMCIFLYMALHFPN